MTGNRSSRSVRALLAFDIVDTLMTSKLPCRRSWSIRPLREALSLSCSKPQRWRPRQLDPGAFGSGCCHRLRLILTAYPGGMATFFVNVVAKIIMQISC